MFQHPVLKFTGYCNDIDNLMIKCLKKERQNKSKLNREKAKERQARVLKNIADYESKQS